MREKDTRWNFFKDVNYSTDRGITRLRPPIYVPPAKSMQTVPESEWEKDYHRTQEEHGDVTLFDARKAVKQ